MDKVRYYTVVNDGYWGGIKEQKGYEWVYLTEITLHEYNIAETLINKN